MCLFFKQKTAYEMRISDWSSDVCSADLTVQLPSFIEYVKENSEYRCGRTYPHIPVRSAYPSQASNRDDRRQMRWQREGRQEHLRTVATRPLPCFPASVRHGWRSEEHTSELQSLMRISYAVFCLKKKKIAQ